MSKIAAVFQKQKAFIAYLTAGDGGIDRTYDAALALVDGGVDILEMGVPFSDPVADGAVIQAASNRAVQNNISIKDVLVLISRIKQKTTTPIILFSYFNPILQAMKKTNFFAEAKKAGVDGVLLVDMPLEESKKYCRDCSDVDIDPIFLLSTSTSIKRIEEIQNYSKGMLYYVCRKGTTGIKSQLPDDFLQKIKTIKSVAKLPVVAGFGISNKETAKEVLQHADGFVIGSLFVDAVAKNKSPQELTMLARSIDPRE